MFAQFPVPRISESFIDGVINGLGWRRYDEVLNIKEGRKNADFIGEDSILELKLIENEGLLQPKRQAKIAELFQQIENHGPEIDIDLDGVAMPAAKALIEIASEPLKGPIKKASRQIRDTKEDLQSPELEGVLVMVNNEYAYLNHENFCHIALDRMKRDSSQIDHVVCVSPEYHQGEFDAFVFLQAECFSRAEEQVWKQFERFRRQLMEEFSNSMSQMMRDQLNPSIWDNSLPPVTDIVFEQNGIRYTRKAPHIPNSMFFTENG